MTKQIKVGSVPVGGGAPVSIQSMCNTRTDDPEATIQQIRRLEEAGCEIVRVAVPDKASAKAIGTIKEHCNIPLVVDIHFDYKLALECIAAGADKVRINPGNIGGWEKTDEVIEAARAAHIPIRVGVNAGSLDDALKARADLTLPEKLAASAVEYVRHFEQRDFGDVVVSAKAHDVQATIATYRALAQEIPQVPLHIGITEAGTLMQGVIKSACGLGILLNEGIGDTMRISLTDEPTEEVRACWMLLAALDLRRRGPEIISCPTCGRCQVNLIDLAKKVDERLANRVEPVKVAVMGCVVNGPGEAADADLGVACGAGSGVVFKRGEVLRKVPEADIVDALMEELEKMA